MAVITITDADGNERMRRDTDAPLLPPPPGWDEARWAGKLVEELVRRIERETAHGAA
jgi:hypothetical protein